MATEDSIVNRLHQPEYTGENRCTPCTIVNVAMAFGASAVLATLSGPLGVLALAAFLGVIYLRGYLVPGTPALTKRYLPDRVLRWFDKEPLADEAVGDAPIVGVAEGEEVDPEPALRAVGALEPCRDRDDLCLTDGFETEWQDRIEAVRGGDYAEYFEALSDREFTDLTVADGDGRCTVVVDGEPAATWESEAAVIADLAAAAALRSRTPDWEDLDVGVRGQLVRGLRAFLDRCPACDGPVAFDERTVESCCLSVEVTTLSCTRCEDRIMEVQV